MKTLKVPFTILFAFLLLFTLKVNAQKPDSQAADSAKIVELEHKWVQVALDGDADTFASMMADNYVGLYPDGFIGRKKGWVEALRSGKTKYNEVKLYDLNIYLNGSTAVVTGKYKESSVRDGKENYFSGSYMDTWAKVNGQWLVVASSFTDDPKEVTKQEK